MEDYLYRVSQQSILATHQLIWNLKSESKNDEEDNQAHGYLKQLVGPDTLPAYSSVMIGKVESLLSPEAKVLYDEEFSYFEILSTVSAKLIKDEPQKRFKLIHDYLDEINSQLVLDDKIIYLPTNPYKKVVKILYDSASPMQSAAKAPYLLSFIVEDFEGPDACVINSRELLTKKANLSSSELNVY